MLSKDVREKYQKFFEERGHKRIAPAPLVLENDPSTLFTSSGMQPLVPYLMGKEHPDGKRVVDSQPCVRTVDIDEIGDNRHLTFFEMLGNWSLGDYFKNDQLSWFYEFLTKELNLPKDKLWVSIFEGNDQVSKDIESLEIWKNLGVAENQIYFYGVKKNWWSRAGAPSEMPVGEIGGPTSEVFFDFGENLGLHERSEWKDEACHPNCDCGRFIEIGNSVFMLYKKAEGNKLEELPNKNVDFGGGLERIVAATNNVADTFQTDLFLPLIKHIEKVSDKKYEEKTKEYRIIIDHFKASVHLASNGIVPSNKAQGYVLRRLIRRAVIKLQNLNIKAKDISKDLIESVFDIYDGVYLEEKNIVKVSGVLNEEIEKFAKTLDKAIQAVGKVQPFDLFQSYGLPGELIEEIYKEKGLEFDKEKFKKELEKHKESSRATSSDKFKLNK